MRINTVRFMGVECLGKGEVLYEQGSRGDKFYVVLMGKVRLLDGGPKSKKVAGRLHPGQGMGDAVLTSNHATYAETAVGAEQTVLATVFREDYHRCGGAQPNPGHSTAEESERASPASRRGLHSNVRTCPHCPPTPAFVANASLRRRAPSHLPSRPTAAAPPRLTTDTRLVRAGCCAWTRSTR